MLGKSDALSFVTGLVTCLALLTSAPCWAESRVIKPSEAMAYVGQEATVCGIVASAKYARKTNGQPTFLNLERPYPDQSFTILIWGKKRPSFGEPEKSYLGKDICVTGLIRNYKGRPQATVTTPEQITYRQ